MISSRRVPLLVVTFRLHAKHTYAINVSGAQLTLIALDIDILLFRLWRKLS